MVASLDLCVSQTTVVARHLPVKWETEWDSGVYISGRLFQEHYSWGSYLCLQGNVLQISRNRCLSFNAFESTFLIENVDWLQVCIWVWRLSVQIGHGSACSSFVLSLCWFSSGLFWTCEEKKSPNMLWSTLRPICTCSRGVLTHSILYHCQCLISKYFTHIYPRRQGSWMAKLVVCWREKPACHDRHLREWRIQLKSQRKSYLNDYHETRQGTEINISGPVNSQ